MIRVAIIDDHRVLTQGLKALLEGSGIAEVVGIANNGAEARHNLPFWKPDVVLLDVGLPDMSGLDLCKEMKAQFTGLRILALTTHDEYSVVRRMMDNGASGYLIKNAMADEVIAGVQAVFEGKQFLSHEIDLLMKQPVAQHIWLSERERKLLKLITEGYTNAEIADQIFLSPETIRGYRKNLLLKLGAKNTAVLVKIALEQKLV